MHARLQFTIPYSEKRDIFESIRTIAPYDKAIVATTNSPLHDDKILLIVLTSDPDIEFILRLKYAGCETHITRF